MKQMEMNFTVIKGEESLKQSSIQTKEVESSTSLYSVTQLNQEVRALLENGFSLVWVQGQISNFKAHPSGHFYFSLKDEKSQISAVMFKGFNRHLKFKLHDGLEVMARGKITVYEPRGSYQVFCEVIEPLGLGSLQLAFEELKKKLQEEGLFDSARKRLLPPYPKHIALVTATSGAAIRDMLHVLNRRHRGLEITIVPAIVQGEKAPQSIIEALKMVNRLKEVDIVIVGRGGGSIEDLWAFNDERVARAIAGSQIPVISAVGHEVDFTIADFVADLRAPTPSAAAEVVVKNSADVVSLLQIFVRRLILAWNKKRQTWRQGIVLFHHRLIDPRRRLADLIFRCDDLTSRLEYLIHHQMGERRKHWQYLTSLLDSLSPLKVIQRGYAIVTNEHSQIVKSIPQIAMGENLNVQLADGALKVKVIETTEK